MELTKRQQEALDVIKAAGAGGIGFKELRKRLKIRGLSTLRGRLGELKKQKAVTSTLSGKTATYRAAV
jgi:predicted transcriptional regulator